jgi:hypothetical protein
MRGAWLAVGLLASTLAWAHPLSRDKYSLRTQLRVASDQVEIVVLLEVPFDVVMGELKDDLEAARSTAQRHAARQVLDAYARKQFSALAAGLSVSIDDTPLKGTWRPKSSPYNGKGAVTEGFFLYMVEFVPDGPAPLDDDVTVVVTNAAYADRPMVYSAWAIDGTGWTVASHSAQPLLPDKAYDPTDAAFWIEDDALRTFTVRAVRAK